MECTKDIDSFGSVPRKPLRARQAVLRRVFVGENDCPRTDIQFPPQRISLFLSANGWAILGAGVDGDRYVADQAS